MNYLGSKKTWLQIFFWGGLWFIIPLLLTNWENAERLLMRNLVSFTGIVVVVFLNLEVLMPKLYFKKKQLATVLVGLVLIALIVTLIEWDGAPWAEYFKSPSQRFRGGGGGGSSGSRPSYYRSGMRYFALAMPYFTSLLGSALYEISSFATQKEKETVKLRNEKLEAEMKFLKSQINPHFLFNALNNIYTLTLIKSDNAPDNLLKLSGMLRYMLYDCKADRVPLHREVEYIRNFIDLNSLKDSKGLNVEASLDNSRPNLMIAPLLFIPFIENAFKHSRIEDLQKGWIKIKLKTSDGHIAFEVQNSLPESISSKDKEGGIGLVNVQRQLELVYPDKHELSIRPGERQFDIYLKIDLT